MPYYGLLGEDGDEISGAGYHRVDVAPQLFALVPPERGEDHVTFINTEIIKFPPARGHWDVVAGIALYDEIDSARPMIGTPIEQRQMEYGDLLVVPPGSLRFGIRWRRDDPDPDPAVNVDHLHDRYADLYADNLTLRRENARLRRENRQLRRQLDAQAK